MERERKGEIYRRVTKEIRATLEGETDLTASMATIACLLHHGLDYFFWTGFYRVVAPGELLIAACASASIEGYAAPLLAAGRLSSCPMSTSSQATSPATTTPNRRSWRLSSMTRVS